MYNLNLKKQRKFLSQQERPSNDNHTQTHKQNYINLSKWNDKPPLTIISVLYNKHFTLYYRNTLGGFIQSTYAKDNKMTVKIT